MGIIKKVTILSLVSATVAGAITKILAHKKHEFSASKMSMCKCRKRDLRKYLTNFFKQCKRKKEPPHKWKKFFKFA
ncbi:MAG: hypothetical protein GX640_10685 [Fibrobacter sp.]|nr:hypothetical protein [Fibrobacter sp.]